MESPSLSSPPSCASDPSPPLGRHQSVKHSLPLPSIDYAFTQEAFWKSIPAWKGVSSDEFADHKWQLKNSVTSLEGISELLGGSLAEPFIQDLQAGLLRTPMNIRITPYIFSLIDWSNPAGDPLRRQFLPLGSQFFPDHPCHDNDSLAEDEDKVTPHLVHRYPDKALFLPITLCPVYCSYCTRSRLVGGSTAVKSKSSYGAVSKEWESSFEYLRQNPQIEDVVVSGGDAFLLRPEQIEQIGMTLLDIPHIRRIRFATKGIAIMPMKILTDTKWIAALDLVCQTGRERLKEVCIHTHFNTENEMTGWTHLAMQDLMGRGIKVRNQSVLIRGINDSFDVMYRTIKKLAYLNIQPYYIYAHDMVPGCEHLRTTVAQANSLSEKIQGTIAGFNTPRVMCDAPGGGGKRGISSYEHYDQELGISVWRAPSVKPGRRFYYFDPIDQLPGERGRQFWGDRTGLPRRLAEFKSKFGKS